MLSIAGTDLIKPGAESTAAEDKKRGWRRKDHSLDFAINNHS